MYLHKRLRSIVYRKICIISVWGGSVNTLSPKYDCIVETNIAFQQTFEKEVRPTMTAAARKTTDSTARYAT
jgi:hypothetical protein